MTTAYRFTERDERVMVDHASASGDRDAMGSLRIGVEPVGRMPSDVMRAALWECGGLTVLDLREREREWVLRHVVDAYWQAFTAAVDGEAR